MRALGVKKHQGDPGVERATKKVPLKVIDDLMSLLLSCVCTDLSLRNILTA